MMSATQEVAQAILNIQSDWKAVNKLVSGINVDHDQLMILLAQIRINSSIIRDWSIRETTK